MQSGARDKGSCGHKTLKSNLLTSNPESCPGAFRSESCFHGCVGTVRLSASSWHNVGVGNLRYGPGIKVDTVDDINPALL